MKCIPLVVKTANLGDSLKSYLISTFIMDFFPFILQSVDKTWLKIVSSHFFKFCLRLPENAYYWLKIELKKSVL